MGFGAGGRGGGKGKKSQGNGRAVAYGQNVSRLQGRNKVTKGKGKGKGNANNSWGNGNQQAPAGRKGVVRTIGKRVQQGKGAGRGKGRAPVAQTQGRQRQTQKAQPGKKGAGKGRAAQQPVKTKKGAGKGQKATKGAGRGAKGVKGVIGKKGKAKAKGKGKGKGGGKGKKTEEVTKEFLDKQLEEYMGPDAMKAKLDSELDTYFKDKKVLAAQDAAVATESAAPPAATECHVARKDLDDIIHCAASVLLDVDEAEQILRQHGSERAADSLLAAIRQIILVSIMSGKGCFTCGGDHFARDCPEGGGGGKGKGKKGKGCFNCGGDHLARDCPEESSKGKGGGKSVDCFNCGGDHFARDCPEESSKGRKGGGKGKGKSVDCFNCGGDHFARDCPEESSKGKGKGKKGGGGGGVCFDFRDNGDCKFGDECRCHKTWPDEVFTHFSITWLASLQSSSHLDEAVVPSLLLRTWSSAFVATRAPAASHRRAVALAVGGVNPFEVKSGGRYDAPADLKPPFFAEKSPSGLRWEVLRKGGGVVPVATDTIKVSYTGWKQSDGVMFDSSYIRQMPSTFRVDNMIKGWGEGMVMMQEGEQRRLWIPGSLAYGETSNSPVQQDGQPLGDLCIDVELMDVVPPGDDPYVKFFSIAAAFLIALSFGYSKFTVEPERREYDNGVVLGFTVER
ncbi:unnamed protein product [Polarella glacialis]|uniref:peptidylprolyl isomerase n=1 Tax=Polarella glacialis TaxID=89957 RepID=A0A813EBM8_POLGL|nr:unnamed protein product [Polarella glacialis]